MATSLTLLTVVGARPQFIKSVALTRALANTDWTECLLHAGQHADDHMGSDFLSELGVSAPHIRLHPSQENRTARMADMMAGIADQIQQRKPAAVLVYGDTDATLAGAMAAHHAGVPLLHVEAGLRSGDRAMPEELNRILTDQLAQQWITTGPGPSRQLLHEGMSPDGVVEAGDVMLDVALAAKAILSHRRPPMWPAEGPVLTATLHRPSLVDHPDRLEHALKALSMWGEEQRGTVYLPVHPRTAANLQRFGLALPDSVVNPGPLGYLDMQAALYHAQVVLTDSGGLQKEAWYQGTGAVVLRNSTEWSELLELGASVLFDPAQLSSAGGPEKMVAALTQPFEAPPVEEAGLFGSGRAAARIVAALDRWRPQA